MKLMFFFEQLNYELCENKNKILSKFLYVYSWWINYNEIYQISATLMDLPNT